MDLSVRKFVETTASEAPAPGGGSVSAAVGALGAALGTMVANLSSHKRGWDDRWEEFSRQAEKGKACHDELLGLVDRDTEAFNAVLAALRLPEGRDEEKATRQRAVQEANRRAIEVPLRIMEVALASMEVIRDMAEAGLPTSVSDAGVGALCARTAVMGAFLNVRINAPSLDDEAARRDFLDRGAALQEQARTREAEILALVEAKLGA